MLLARDHRIHQIMEPLFIKSTSDSPEVNFNPEDNNFEISGLLIPEDPASFYKPIIDWVNEYIKNPNPITSISLKIEYINTSSSKSLVQILRVFEKLNKTNDTVAIKWYWEDEDMLEAARDYQSVLKIPFEIIEVAEFH